MTYILALDTSSKQASITLAKGEETLAEYNFSAHNTLSAALVPAVDFLLKNAGLKLSDIHVFGVGIGPGVFTGIRVGLATLKGLNFTLRRPVVPVVTLQALAYKYLYPGMAAGAFIIPLIDAKRDEVYLTVYHVTRQGLKEEVSPRLIHIEELKRELESHGAVPFYFVGSGAGAHKAQIEENFKAGKILQRSPFLSAEIARIAYEAYLKKDYITDLQELLPLYIRKPDAEQKAHSLEKKDRDKNKAS
ncbi:MAG: tRNA (adenosine(37)-N6)-threonylcarbamoyltransferase complex dimerization subunit type 1 TsaB [Candidatus Aminicenantes bacterium]|nr:tRNA (adenosine(37)-N6)-threonylcarbamoyltransferase complex dimerization subunit type 1 TsaB [Candidatus Aminicenantes bacterium]